MSSGASDRPKKIIGEGTVRKGGVNSGKKSPPPKSRPPSGGGKKSK